MPNIGALTVCINFDDYLSHTLASMVRAFDRVVVVTSEADRATRNLCDTHQVEAVLSDRAHHLGEAFNLPALANDGYRALGAAEWACKIDPDILLPDEAGPRMRAELADPDLLWGASRYFAETPAVLTQFRSSGDWGLLEPPYESSADVLGFLQVFHTRSRAMAGRTAPYEDERFEGPSRSNDRLFSSMWAPEQQRRLSFDVVHLGLDAIGTNWRGRKAPSFR